ncbi:MAG: DUF4349 domain-containing protein [Bacteroidota bacterium]
MKLLYQVLAALLLCIFIACHENSSADTGQTEQLRKNVSASKTADKSEGDQLTVIADTVPALQNNQIKPSQLQGKAPAHEDWDKKIVKTGNLTMEVKSYKTFNDMLHTGIKQLGGYVAQEEQSQSDYRIENTITIKVPVDQFDNAISKLTPFSEKILEKKITAEDVTAEIVDTKSRMIAKEKVRDRYLDLLKQAKNMKEILEVQTEVNDIQENIEAATGRIGYLGHAAAFSTIHISFYQVLNAPINDLPPSYSTRILESFNTGMHWFADLLVVFVSLWPLLMGVGAAWFFIRKYKVSAAKKHKAVSSQ